MLLRDERCPACDSTYICHLQPIYLQRQKKTVPQFFCMDCNTFYHRSGYVEDEGQLHDDTEWLIAHPGDYAEPIAEIRKMLPNAKTCFEAGCGAGALLHQLEKAGFRAEGIDPNAVAVAHGVKTYGVKAKYGYFKDTGDKYDIVFCIDVLEHLERPRAFFADLVASLNDGGAVAVRVPNVERDRWSFLDTAPLDREIAPGDPFCDNSVHINHLSIRGLIEMASQLGMPHHRYISQGLFAFTKEPIPTEEASVAPSLKRRLFAAAGFR
jgi:SAM-dependent methyltransferase